MESDALESNLAKLPEVKGASSMEGLAYWLATTGILEFLAEKYRAAPELQFATGLVCKKYPVRTSHCDGQYQ